MTDLFSQFVFISSCFVAAAAGVKFSFVFGLFNQISLQILQQIYVKNVHLVYGAGIRTHDLRNVSLFP